jgi:DNA repair protein RadC
MAMEYEININYRFVADSEREARERAKAYIANNLKITPLPDGIFTPSQVAEQCRSFRKAKKEHFVVFFLDTHHTIIGKEKVSIGTLNSSLVHPRECFRTAILKNCAAVILAHNHPSGNVKPSDDDIAVTKRLTDAGKLLGIEVLDHIIVAGSSYKSLKEAMLI